MKDSFSPTVTIGTSQGKTLDQGYTYSQPTLTYSQVGASYGGFYGYNDVLQIRLVGNPIISASNSSNVLQENGSRILQENGNLILTEQSQALYNDITPKIFGFMDIYTAKIGPSNLSIGPGWFMFITH